MANLPATKTLLLFTSLLLALTSMTACAERHGGRVGGTDDFHPGTTSLGKVALWIAGTEEGEYAKAHAPSVRRIMSTALARLPATEVITAPASPAEGAGLLTKTSPTPKPSRGPKPLAPTTSAS